MIKVERWLSNDVTSTFNPRSSVTQNLLKKWSLRKTENKNHIYINKVLKTDTEDDNNIIFTDSVRVTTKLLILINLSNHLLRWDQHWSKDIGCFYLLI